MVVRFKIPSKIDEDDVDDSDTFDDSELDGISSDEDETTSDDTDKLGGTLSNFMIKQSGKKKNNNLTDYDGFSVNDDGTVVQQMRSILALQDVIGMKDDVPFMMEMEKKEQEKKKLANMTPEERIQFEEDQAGDVMAKIKQRQVERKKEDEARKIKKAQEAAEWAVKQKEFEERQAKERREKEAAAAAAQQRELEARKAREQRALEARKAKEKLEAEAAAAAAAVRESMKKKKEMVSMFTSDSEGDNGEDPFGADFSMSSPVFNKNRNQQNAKQDEMFATANGFGIKDDGWGTAAPAAVMALPESNGNKPGRQRTSAKDSDDDVSGDSSIGESDYQENKKKKKHCGKSKEEKKSKKKKKKSSKSRKQGDDGTGDDENDEISGESEHHPPQQQSNAHVGRMTTEAEQMLPKVLRELFDQTFESDDMDEVAWKPGERVAVKKAILSSYEIHRSIRTLEKLLPQTEKSRIAQSSLTELIDKQRRQLDAILKFEDRLLTSFENGLKEVVQYKVDHGHLNFDKDPTTVNSKLKSFLSKQRNRYRDYKHHEQKSKEKYRLNYRHLIRGEDIKALRDFGVSLSSSSSSSSSSNNMGSSSHKASSRGSGRKSSVKRQKSGSSDRRASTRHGASAVSSSSASRNRRRQSSAM